MGVVAEQRSEQDQEDHRQREREEATLRVSPRDQQVVAQLMCDQLGVAHVWPSVSSRYTSSSAGRCTCRSPTSTPCARAQLDSACSVSITALLSINTRPL